MKRFKFLFFPSILIFLVCISYVNSLNNGFVSDDIPGIVQTGASWTWHMVTTDIRFLTRWTSMLQFFMYQFVGLSPWGYRLINIVFHVLAVLLVQAIVTRLSNKRIGFLTGALFAVHPIIVESVTWISGGVYAQYVTVFLLSFWLFLKQKDVGRRKNVWYVSSIVFYGISLFFSEKAAVLFLLFFVYTWSFETGKKQWMKLIPYVFLSSIFIFFYSTHLGSRIAEVAVTSGGGVGTLYNPLQQIPLAISTYLKLIVWPSDLTLYHDERLNPVGYVFRLAVFALYCFGLIYTAWKKRNIFFWLSWFLIPLLPTLTPFRIAWVVAERYAYMSVIGIFVCIAYWFDWMLTYSFPEALRSQKKFYVSSVAGVFSPFRSSRLASEATKIFSASRALLRIFQFSVLLGIILIYLAFITRTIIRNRDWTSEDTLWIATAQISPTVPYTWNNMGDVYSRHGDLEKAAESFQRAIRLNPKYADAHHNLGQTYRTMGEVGDAILMYEKALVYNPNLWQSHASLAAIYYAKKDYQMALNHIEQALKIVPSAQMLITARDQIKTLLP